MARDEVIRIRVHSEEKEDIREHVENVRHASGMSDYFRTLAYRDMQGELGSDVDIDVSEVVDELSGEMKSVESQIRSLEAKINSVVDAVSETEDEVAELATEVYDVLPVGDDGLVDEYNDVINERNMVTPNSDLEIVQQVSDVKSWAIYFGESEEMMERALDYCKKYMPAVGKQTIRNREDGVEDKTVQYWKGDV